MSEINLAFHNLTSEERTEHLIIAYYEDGIGSGGKYISILQIKIRKRKDVGSFVLIYTDTCLAT